MEIEPQLTLWEKYETDPEKETAGVPVDIDGIIFMVRRAGGGNRAYRYALAEAAQDFRHLFAAEPRDNYAIFDANEEIQMRAFAKTIIASWSKNMVDRKGAPLPFSEEAALDLLRTCPTIWDRLKGVAIDDDRYKPDGEELGKLSAGIASGAPA